MKKTLIIIILLIFSFSFTYADENKCIVSGKVVESNIKILKTAQRQCLGDTLYLTIFGSGGIYKLSGRVLPNWLDYGCGGGPFITLYENIYVPQVGENINFLVEVSDNGNYLLSRDNFDYSIGVENDMIAFSYIDSDKSQWDYPICSPNVTEQEETEIRLGAVKSQLTDLHNRKPWSVKNILNSLEKMNFSKYGEKAVNLIEITKEIIKSILSN